MWPCQSFLFLYDDFQTTLDFRDLSAWHRPCNVFILAHLAELQAYLDTVEALPLTNETIGRYRPTPNLSILHLTPDHWYPEVPLITPEQITSWMEGLSSSPLPCYSTVSTPLPLLLFSSLNPGLIL